MTTPRKNIVGYADRLSAVPGERIRFMVSCEDGERDYRARLVRLLCTDDHPDGPGLVERPRRVRLRGHLPGPAPAAARRLPHRRRMRRASAGAFGLQRPGDDLADPGRPAAPDPDRHVVGRDPLRVRARVELARGARAAHRRRRARRDLRRRDRPAHARMGIRGGFLGRLVGDPSALAGAASKRSRIPASGARRGQDRPAPASRRNGDDRDCRRSRPGGRRGRVHDPPLQRQDRGGAAGGPGARTRRDGTPAGASRPGGPRFVRRRGLGLQPRDDDGPHRRRLRQRPRRARGQPAQARDEGPELDR